MADIFNDPPDPADIADDADANAYEELSHEGDNSTPIFPNQPTEPPLNPDPTGQLDEPETEDEADHVPSQGMSTPVVDRFPFGSPGMPIPNKPRAPSAYESQQATSTDLPWAPFRSKLDWDIAQWAKMHGQSSATVSDLLRMPDVRVSL
jgi:hypothetical protein